MYFIIKPYSRERQDTFNRVHHMHFLSPLIFSPSNQIFLPYVKFDPLSNKKLRPDQPELFVIKRPLGEVNSPRGRILCFAPAPCRVWRKKGSPQNQRFCGERRNNGASELSGLPGSERYGVCSDESHGDRTIGRLDGGVRRCRGCTTRRGGWRAWRGRSALRFPRGGSPSFG